MGKRSLSKKVCIVFLFCAAVVTLSSAQTFTTLANFNGTNGAWPSASVIQATDGNFYGTSFGDSGTDGTVFKITPSGILTTLHRFCSLPNCADGSFPSAALLQAADGNFYGTTTEGGTSQNCPLQNGCGTVFKITPTGALTSVYNFCSLANCADGETPYAVLLQGADGSLYGTTQNGGVGSLYGTVFKLTPTGTLTTVYSFCSQQGCTDGAFPNETLVRGADGKFYGTTNNTGIGNGHGTVFSLTPSGILTTLYSFCSQPNCSDGEAPMAGLVQATDGNFYGTTYAGGNNNCNFGFGCGTIFRITPSGALTTLYRYSSDPYGTVSYYPSLLQGTDGSLYGVTQTGGAQNQGTIFRITTAGTLTVLYSFCSAANCTDGAGPTAALLQAADGSFYGTTRLGGTGYCGGAGCGTVFSLSVGIVLSPVQFVPVTPCRLVDTRQTDNPIQGGTFQFFVVPQLGGCNIPATAAAYSLNVTVVPHQPLGYLTIWPAGRPQPYVSTMNSPDGRTKANAAIIPAGASGAVSVYATATTDVILDIDGYFTAPASGTYQFYPLTPCRLVDTRGADGDLGGPRLAAQMARSFPLLESGCIPNGLNPLAYSLNFTVVPNPSGQRLGYLSVWPTGESQPVVSTLNNPTATVVANAAIVPAGTGGAVDVYAYNTTDLLIDINGYFAAPGQGGLSMYPVTPCRVLDTRQNNGQPFKGEKTVNVVGSACAPPSNAAAYIFNATAVPPGSMPYLTLWPDGEQQPVVSTLNAYDGFITSNMAIVPTNNGSIDAYAYALTQLILDISGYFAP